MSCKWTLQPPYSMQSDYPGVERNKPQGTSSDVNALTVAASPAIRRDDNLNQAGVSK